MFLSRRDTTFHFYCLIVVLLSVEKNRASYGSIYYDDNLEGTDFAKHQCYPNGFIYEKQLPVKNNGGDVLKPSLELKVEKYGDEKVIKGTIKWKHVPETQSDKWVKGYQMVLEAVGPDHCHQKFSTLLRNLTQFDCGYDVPFGYDHEYLHILNFRCNYTLKLSTIPCDSVKCHHETKNIIIGDCNEIASGCICKDVPSVENLTAVVVEDSTFSSNQSTVRVQWNYPNEISSSSKANKFIVLLFDDVTRPSKFDVETEYGVSVYQKLLNISGALSTNIEDILLKVVAEDGDNCRSAYKSTFTFREYNANNSSITTNSVVSNTSLEFMTTNGRMSSLVIVLLLISGLILILLIAGFTLIYQRFNARKTQQRLSHPRNLAQFKLVLNAKPSFNTFSTGKEGINAMYIEQEIQEALDKGVVDHYEISPNKIVIGHEIGTGAFGQVFIATMSKFKRCSDKTVVAVKFLRECSTELEKQDFLREIDVMKRAGHHPNVIHMIACCTIQQPICMIMEFVEYGDLLNYLRKLQSAYKVMKTSNSTLPALSNDSTKSSRTSPRQNDDSFLLPTSDLLKEFDQSDSASSPQTDLSEWSEMTFETNTSSCCSKNEYQLNPKQLLSFAWQIANGMNHLVKQGIVHRDLAARNVLIGLDKVLKISDFGLSRRGVYVTRRGGKVPLRWLSIEAITHNVYSTQSDVWSYGVVLWEICTLGGYPYSTVGDKEILKYLLNNKRLEKPPQCTEKLYQVMMTCWDMDPLARPTFQLLLNIINDMEKDPHKYVNFDFENSNDSPKEPA